VLKDLFMDQPLELVAIHVLHPYDREEYQRWSADKCQFLKNLEIPGSVAERQGWQRDFMVGCDNDDHSLSDHQTELKPLSFTDTHSIRGR
jgi:hypothetical protein